MSDSVQIIDKTMSLGRANLWATLLMLPALALFLIPYQLIWDENAILFTQNVEQFLLLMLAFFVSIVIHEGLHGLGYAYGGVSWSDVKFGIKHLTPYAHCQVALPLNAYRLAVALPGLVLGVIPGLLGLLFGIGWLTFFGAIMSVAATGDALILWLLRDAPPQAEVVDHPSKMGCQLRVQQGEQE